MDDEEEDEEEEDEYLDDDEPSDDEGWAHVDGMHAFGLDAGASGGGVANGGLFGGRQPWHLQMPDGLEDLPGAGLFGTLGFGRPGGGSGRRLQAGYRPAGAAASAGVWDDAAEGGMDAYDASLLGAGEGAAGA
jgi:hypothetical protein